MNCFWLLERPVVLIKFTKSLSREMSPVPLPLTAISTGTERTEAITAGFMWWIWKCFHVFLSMLETRDD